VRGKFGLGERGKTACVSHFWHGRERRAGGAESQVEKVRVAGFTEFLQVKFGEFIIRARIFGVVFNFIFD
jgi:hypothetical protein